MGLPENILVVVDQTVANDSAALTALLDKAVFLTGHAQTGELECSLRLATVVYEPLLDWRASTPDSRQRVIDMVLEHAETRLSEAVTQAGHDSGKMQFKALWGSSTWRAVMEHVESEPADLIIKTHRHDAGDAVPRALGRTPEDWNLLRHSSVPVLLTGQAPWQEPTSVIVAVDAFAEVHEPLNDRLLDAAGGLAQMLAAHLHVVSTFPRLQPWIVELGVAPEFEPQAESLEAEGRRRISEALQRANIEHAQIDVRQGDARAAVSAVAEAVGPVVVVLGTHARSGVRGAVLGNTAEKLLDELTQDVLVVS